MKIDRLYTLSQFVELVVKEISIKTGINLPGDINSGNVDEWSTMSLHALGDIRKYNNFLKQPLTKDMFVNDMKHPTLQYYDLMYYGCELDIWQEAEKKVIFKAMPTNKKDCLNIIKDSVFSHFIGNKIYIENIHINSGRMLRVNTISELSEVTKGKLKLNNVEL